MNNKTLIIVIALLIVIGGALLIGGKLTNKKSGNTTQTSVPTTAQQTQSNQNGQVQVGKPITETIETVNITSSGFNPQSITIKNGSKVIWINKSGADVNIVPTNKYAPLTLGQFPNNSSVQLLFDKAGTYTYQNQLKTSQTGTVIVQ
ncbi:MAG: hypothetical protein AAB531_01865 [Patescibacteria group bacterium]